MRKTENFCSGWLFHSGDVDRKYPIQKGPIYTQSKTITKIWGAAAMNYNDSSDGYTTEREVCTENWVPVNLPHDFTIAESPSKENNVTLGFLPLGNGWYRKRFTLCEADKGKQLFLDFEAVATHSEVYINGCLAARHFGGATPFRVDITNFVIFDGENVVAVYVNNSESEGWWYGGGGIYRPVWLVKADKISVDKYGIYVHPEKVNDSKWNVPVEITLRNDNTKCIAAQIEILIQDNVGNEIISESVETEMTELSNKTVYKNFSVENPMLWDTNTPNLYLLKTIVKVGGEAVDVSTVRFGFRTICFDSQKGFFLNGLPVKIKGVCCHQDYGLTGKAVPERVQRYRIKLLKEMGANGYRTAHYPHSETTMDFLDEMGFLVMNETRWFSTNEESIEALETLIKRDRNRPGVIMWSIGNEEPITLTDNGKKISERLREVVKKLDTSRPVTSAICNDPLDNAIPGELDVIGINYNIECYDDMHKKYPNIPIIASECCATGTTRGWYMDTCEKRGYLKAYDRDTNHWFLGRERTWKYLCEREWVAGSYQWAGIEHRGEGGWWPRLSSASGAIDLYLQKKDAFYQNQSHWRDEPMIHLLPHWNWIGHEGSDIDVWAYTNCDEAELFLNSISLGKIKIEKYGHAEWKVPYAAGELKVFGYRDGVVVTSDSIQTTGSPAALMLKLEDSGVRTNDVAIITCYAVDEEGREVPDASPFISFDTNELGFVEATGADNTDNVPPHCPDRKMWQGKCSVLVRTKEKTGRLRAYAKSNGLRDAILEIEITEKGERL